jgi:hypothetical protein
MNLLDEWAKWKVESPPYVLASDLPIILSERTAHTTVIKASWNEAITAEDFCAPGDTRLHLGLLPIPYVGDMQRATVFILLLNPGLGPDDYFGEYQIMDYREALLSNLKQDFSNKSQPFLFLDPQYSWHGGFDWWHSKLAGVIGELAKIWRTTYSSARTELGRSLACIELFPYRSRSFNDIGGWLRNLQSVQLARSYVHDVVMQRVHRKEAIVIVTRQTRVWGITEGDNVVVYTGSEARAAYLTPSSRGGKAIIAHLSSRGRP